MTTTQTWNNGSRFLVETYDTNKELVMREWFSKTDELIRSSEYASGKIVKIYMA